jgi:hypothetical protein
MSHVRSTLVGNEKARPRASKQSAPAVKAGALVRLIAGPFSVAA